MLLKEEWTIYPEVQHPKSGLSTKLLRRRVGKMQEVCCIFPAYRVEAEDVQRLRYLSKSVALQRLFYKID